MKTTSSHRTRALRILERQGVSRSKDFGERGIPRSTLRRLHIEGEIERVARGVYALPERHLGEHQSLLELSTQVPDGVICLLSALAYHEIGTQLPHEVWMALGSKARRPKISQIATRFVRFSPGSLGFGVEHHKVRGMTLRVTTPAKTVADCFKYRNKIGLDVALEALRDGFESGMIRLPDLEDAARVCRVGTVMRPYLESLLG